MMLPRIFRQNTTPACVPDSYLVGEPHSSAMTDSKSYHRNDVATLVQTSAPFHYGRCEVWTIEKMDAISVKHFLGYYGFVTGDKGEGIDKDWRHVWVCHRSR